MSGWVTAMTRSWTLFERFFWGYYAAVYDTLLVFQPYRQLMSAVATGLRLPPEARVLDAGCGTGNVTVHLAQSGFQVVSLDASQPMLARASSKCSTQVVCADLNQTLPFADNTFSGITCSNALYSVGRPVETLKEFRRILQPKGQLVLSNPLAGFSMGQVMRTHWSASNWRGRLAFLVALPQILVLVFFNLLLLHLGVKRQLHFTSGEQLSTLLQESGFESMEIRPCYANQGVLAVARSRKSLREGD